MQVHYFESKEEAEIFFYGEVAKYPKYVGWFWNWYRYHYEVRFEPPFPKYPLTIIKINGRL